jgi:cyclohexanecarboxylate-CoA ligase
MKPVVDLHQRVERLARARAESGYREKGFWRDRTIAEAFESTCRAQPGEIALIDGATRLEFTRLQEAVHRCAGGLQKIGVCPGDAVAYQLPNWWEAAVTFLASIHLGAFAVPIVPFLSSREVGFILAETTPRVFVSPERLGRSDFTALLDRALSDGAPAPAARIVVRPEKPNPKAAIDFSQLLAAPSGAIAEPAAAPDRLALVVYTSGSTAAPKGVLHSHQTLAAELQSLRAAHGLGPGDRVLMPSPLTHISGVIHGILAPALLGTAAVLMDRWVPAAALDLLADHRVTYMVGAPNFLQDILTQPRLEAYDLSRLRLFSCGGAAVSEDLMRRGRDALPGLTTKRVYGSSEFPTIATTSADDPLERGWTTEGRPLPGVDLRICDPGGTPLPPGSEGEIRARGPDCFLGYVDPVLDADAFDPAGFLRTGDLGVIDASGYLTVTGRVKEIIVRKGEKISAREVEELIALHPAVAEVAVVAIPDPETGERACACIRCEESAPPPNLGELSTFLRNRDLTSRKLPERLVVFESFPRAPSGKIHKKRLQAEVSERLARHPGER